MVRACCNEFRPLAPIGLHLSIIISASRPQNLRPGSNKLSRRANGLRDHISASIAGGEFRLPRSQSDLDLEPRFKLDSITLKSCSAYVSAILAVEKERMIYKPLTKLLTEISRVVSLTPRLSPTKIRF